jgi:hypothetical protein
MGDGRFEVRILRGEVISENPEFIGKETGRTSRFHMSLEAANAHADEERDAGFAEGWGSAIGSRFDDPL